MDPETTPRVESIYDALHRPRLWFGCHQLPLAIAATPTVLCTIPMVILHNLGWLVVGIAWLSLSVAGLRALARFDPDFWAVVGPFGSRYRKYNRIFSALASANEPYAAPRRHQR